METTMTISVKIELSAPATAGGFRNVDSSDVSVISIVGERDDSSIPLSAVLRACTTQFKPFLADWLRALPQHRIILFCATPFWDHHNVVSKRRGVWGSEGLDRFPAEARRSPSVEINGDGGARFAGLLEIGTNMFFDAAEFARIHDSSLLLVLPSPELNEQLVHLIFTQAFPRGDSRAERRPSTGLI
jgi:hypothetical protein